MSHHTPPIYIRNTTRPTPIPPHATLIYTHFHTLRGSGLVSRVRPLEMSIPRRELVLVSHIKDPCSSYATGTRYHQAQTISHQFSHRRDLLHGHERDSEHTTPKAGSLCEKVAPFSVTQHRKLHNNAARPIQAYPT
jgi:hypothetical protein